MIKRILVLLIFLGIAVGVARAAGPKTAVDRSGIDMETLGKLMQTGQMLIVEEKPDGTLKSTTGGIVINAPTDKVYQTLIQFDKYYEFMPSTEDCKVVKDEGNRKDVYFRIKFEFSVLSWEVEYVLHQEFVTNSEMFWTLAQSKDNLITEATGSWKLYPLPGGKTAAFYSQYSNLRNISWVVKKVLDADPSMEVAINTSACIMVLKAVKNRLEKPNYTPNLDKKK